MPILIDSLVKKYQSFGKEIAALDGITLSFADGEFAAVVGESGSGKSTLLNMLCGMDIPDSGRIMLGTADLTAMSSDDLAKLRRSKIGVIYQFYNLVAELNVKDNITLPVELDDRRQDDAFLKEILEAVGLCGRERDFPAMLSGGQQQRVAIARAIYQRPSVILADEPTGNLDEKNAEQILKLLLKINKDYGITFIIVTHSQIVANSAKRVISISNGRIVEDVRR